MASVASSFCSLFAYSCYSASSLLFFFLLFSPFSPLAFFTLGFFSCPSTSSWSLSVHSSEVCSLISSNLSSFFWSPAFSGYQPSSLSLMRPRSSSYMLSLHLKVESPPPPAPPMNPTVVPATTPLTRNMLSFEVLNWSDSMDSTSSSKVIPPLGPPCILRWSESWPSSGSILRSWFLRKYLLFPGLPPAYY